MSLPDYAGLTRDDPNPLKRWLQRRRLDDALAALPRDLEPRVVVDYGAGDGELARRLAERFSQARVVAFEPAPEFAAAARLRLGTRGEVVEDEDALPEAADLVVCTEVFEHLPPEQEVAALERIGGMLGANGRLLIGVPVEVGPPALVKGLFRMARRAGEEDARPGAIWAAFSGRPSRERGTVLLAGRPYHPSHTGFDHRAFAARLRARFEVEGARNSPLARAPVWASAETYMLARNRS